jgi:hypothetical protein
MRQPLVIGQRQQSKMSAQVFLRRQLSLRLSPGNAGRDADRSGRLGWTPSEEK